LGEDKDKKDPSE
jgi:serine/threonine protein phosphatase PrpC